MSSREYLCAFGDCQETMGKDSFKLTLTERSRAAAVEQEHFCCYEHAIRWLQKRDTRLNRRRWPDPMDISPVSTLALPVK